jgi:hypothetical protein
LPLLVRCGRKVDRASCVAVENRMRRGGVALLVWLASVYCTHIYIYIQTCERTFWTRPVVAVETRDLASYSCRRKEEGFSPRPVAVETEGGRVGPPRTVAVKKRREVEGYEWGDNPSSWCVCVSRASHGCIQYTFIQRKKCRRTFCTRPVVFVVVPGG